MLSAGQNRRKDAPLKPSCAAPTRGCGRSVAQESPLSLRSGFDDGMGPRGPPLGGLIPICILSRHLEGHCARILAKGKSCVMS